MGRHVLTLVLVLGPVLLVGLPHTDAAEPRNGLTVQNGWYVHNGQVVYAMEGGQFQLELTAAKGAFQAKWFDPRKGTLSNAGKKPVEGGGIVTFSAPDVQDWALWIDRDASLR